MYRKSLKSLTSTTQQEGLFPESVIILEVVQWESSAYKWSMWFVGAGALYETNLKPTIKRTISQLAFGYHQLLEIQTTSRIKIHKDGLCSPASSTKVTLSPCQLQ